MTEWQPPPSTIQSSWSLYHLVLWFFQCQLHESDRLLHYLRIFHVCFLTFYAPCTTNCRQYASIVLAIMLYMEWSCRNSVIERHLSFSAHPTPTDTHTLSLAGILAQKKRGTSHAFPIAVYLLLRMSQPEGLEQQIYMREATHFSTSSILAVGSNLATTLPFLSTTNLVKFHLISGLFL